MSSRTHLALRLFALALLAGALAWPRPAPRHELGRGASAAPRHAEVVVAAADRAHPSR